MVGIVYTVSRVRPVGWLSAVLLAVLLLLGALLLAAVWRAKTAATRAALGT
jgi:hypothetical protein